MSVEKARTLVERHDSNSDHIRAMRQALAYLSDDNEQRQQCRATINVTQGTVHGSFRVPMELDLAKPFFEAELERLESEQRGIEQQLAAL